MAEAGLRLALLALALLGLLGLDWLAIAPNRLLPGEGVRALAAMPPASVGALLLAGLAAAWPWSSAGRARVALLLLGAALLLALAATGWGARAALLGKASSARASLGPGFWVAAGALLLLFGDLARRAGLRGLWATGALAAGAAALAASGALDALSLIVEARARGAALWGALLGHLSLAAGALLIALAVAAPLALLGLAAPRLVAAAEAFLGAVQVVPAIALFGLLLALLSALLAVVPGLRALGLAAIGPTPAVIGVAAYLALPLLSAFAAGLRAADPAAVEAARAMGFTGMRIAREVRLPLGWPLLRGGLRVATVQSVGLVTLGGLIGAGGFGALVFEGMAQFAPDLILLGALPVVALALLADRALEGGRENLRR